MNDSTIFETKLVGEIEGRFIVKDYQRGYRWEKEEVERLLEDIYSNGDKSYFLQPIVIKKEDNEKYELIDGQQRLTTIYLIYKYMNNIASNFFAEPKFSICYETRDETEEFLQKIDLTKENDNIDFFYLSQAYKTIDNYFSNNKQSVLTKFNEYLDDNVKVLWYEVDSEVESIPLFTRLNIGKIPLTSSELVKALFLSENNKETEIEKIKGEIALEWDNVERELHNNRFWYFLTNSNEQTYHTRIDLILDLITRKNKNCKEKYYTYFKIEEMNKQEKISTKEIWYKYIYHTFLILKDWYENHELYHKIGYLITINYLSLQEIYDKILNKNKDEAVQILNEEIRKSIKVEQNYSELLYDMHYEKIFKLLMLFNIESVRANGENTQWFPFDKFKYDDVGKKIWSLEHIHARNSENLKKEEEWRAWLDLHLNVLENIERNDTKLIDEIKSVLEKKNIEESTFSKYQTIIVNKLSDNNILYDQNTIANLALLNSGNNSALNNSTFAVKRDKIIEMDQKGEYIPFCTRMIFLKYYTPSKDNQIYFWSQKDMEAYINKLNEVLREYLDGNYIDYEME